MSRPTFPFLRPAFWTGFAFAVYMAIGPSAAVAQCPAAETPEKLQRHEFPEGIEVDDPIDSREACPTWRWVAIKADDEPECPQAQSVSEAHWTVQRLFSDRGAGRPPVLDPFCIYEYEGSDLAPLAELNSALERLMGQGRLLEVESGCAAVSPSSSRKLGKSGSKTPPNWPLLEDFFFEQTGDLGKEMVVSVEELTQAEPGICRSSVRVGVIDTRPKEDPATIRYSDHGFAITRLIESLTCEALHDEQHCAARVSPRLGLPIVEFDWADPNEYVRSEKGGYFGTVDQLASAVWDELEDWRETGESRLVLNLSVGWVGERFGGLEEEVDGMPVPVRALYRALEVASCRGALVVAAAGNRVGGPTIETGPLLPGGWERRQAPGHAQCHRILGRITPERRQPYGAPLGPLVYAAGGVHADDSPLSNARPESEPPRVAYADHAVVPMASAERPSFLTGSSVAAAVVSATAATVWHHRPELDRDELMSLVDESGKQLGRTADVSLGDSPVGVRRIRVCEAVEHACRKPRACPEVEKLDCAGPSKELSTTPPCDSPNCPLPSLELADLGGEIEGLEVCDQTTLRFDEKRGTPSHRCPFRQFYGINARPWTGPQPEDDPCTGCTVDPPPNQGPGFVQTAAWQAAGIGVIETRWLTMVLDPEWCPYIEGAVFAVGKVHFALDIVEKLQDQCPSSEPITIVYKGFPASLFAAKSGAPAPKPVLYFDTSTQGSIQSPVFVGR